MVTPQTCQEIYVLSLLTSGRPEHIARAAGLLCTAGSEVPAVTNVYLRRLPHHAAQRLVVAAAREYFDGSASLADPGIRLARQCLQVGTWGGRLESTLTFIAGDSVYTCLWVNIFYSSGFVRSLLIFYGLV